MNIIHTEGMLSWKLKDTMEAHGVTRYALQQKSGVAMNTLRSMYDGSTERPDLKVLDTVIKSLREMTGQKMTLTDILEWKE